MAHLRSSSPEQHKPRPVYAMKPGCFISAEEEVRRKNTTTVLRSTGTVQIRSVPSERWNRTPNSVRAESDLRVLLTDLRQLRGKQAENSYQDRNNIRWRTRANSPAWQCGTLSSDSAETNPDSEICKEKKEIRWNFSLYEEGNTN